MAVVLCSYSFANTASTNVCQNLVKHLSFIPEAVSDNYIQRDSYPDVMKTLTVYIMLPPA